MGTATLNALEEFDDELDRYGIDLHPARVQTLILELICFTDLEESSGPSTLYPFARDFVYAYRVGRAKEYMQERPRRPSACLEPRYVQVKLLH